MQSSDYSSNCHSMEFKITGKNLKILRLLKYDHCQNNLDITVREDSKRWYLSCKTPSEAKQIQRTLFCFNQMFITFK